MEKSKLVEIIKKDKNKPHQLAFDSRIFLNKTCKEIEKNIELIEELQQKNKIHYSHEYVNLKNNLIKAYNQFSDYLSNEFKKREINSSSQQN
jgi:hypothetical protein